MSTPQTATPLIEKTQFKNMTDGWIGAVVIGPKGDEKGVPVEPGGTVWLSQAEQILTANAPRRPEDNPFIEQAHIVEDPTTGEKSEVKRTPLVVVEENRYVPANIRPIPADLTGATDAAIAADAAGGSEPSVPTVAELGALQRSAEVEAMGEKARPHQQPPVPPRAALAAALAADAAKEEDAPADPSQEAAQAPETAKEEETAAQTGDETGAAVAPGAPAVKGEYAAQEEVGTPTVAAPPVPPAPVAPTSPGAEAGAAEAADRDAADRDADTPPPYTPPQG